MKGKIVALLLRGILDAKVGRVISFPAGTSARVALRELKTKSFNVGKRLSDEEMAARETRPVKICGVDFPNAASALVAINAFGDQYGDRDFVSVVDVREALRNLANQ